MKTKLTLTIEKSVIEKAKVLAQQSGKSLSELIEKHLSKEIQQIEKDQKPGIPSQFENLFGSVDLPKDLNEKEEIRKILSKKHSR